MKFIDDILVQRCITSDIFTHIIIVLNYLSIVLSKSIILDQNLLKSLEKQVNRIIWKIL